MIYLKESFDLAPATPANRDRFVRAVEDGLLPAQSGYGARLVAGWFANEDWFSQIVHITEFPEMGALGEYRAALRTDAKLITAQAALAGLAPERRSELLEPLGPIPVSALQAAIDAAAGEPVGVYTFAILEVREGAMDRFESFLTGARDSFPIVASWRDVIGNTNRVIDLWKGDMGAQEYRATNAAQDAFFDPLREIAPREKLMRLHPLPYSPLR